MIFLPIVERELRVAARRSGTYWGRAAVALVAAVVWLWTSVSYSLSVSPSRSGAELFNILSTFAFGFALMAGLRSTSDCLSREKREGTLGLLFLTDLKGYDVVFGKLAATSLGALYGLLAVLPVLAIPLLMGGVAAGTFWRVALVLLNTLFFSLACGLFVSAISREERKAMGGTLLLIFLVTAGLPLVGFGFNQFQGNGALRGGFLLPSPGLALFLSLSPLRTAVWSSADFWRSLWVTHLLSWSLLGLASWIAPHSWKDKPATVKRLRWREWWRNLILGNAARRHAFRRRLLEINPIFWLSSRERQTASYPWIFLASMGVIWIWAWGIDRRFWSEVGLAFFITYGLHLFMKSWVLTLACNSMAVDRDNGAMELVLSTPLTVPELLHGQWLALRRQFLFPIAAILLFDAFWLALGVTVGNRPGGGSPEWFWVLAFLASVGMFVVDLVTLAWVGMWLGVRSRRHGQAAQATMARVLVLPWLIFLVASVFLISIGFLAGLGTPSLLPGMFVLGWFIIGLVIDLLFARQAYWKLHHELRSVAAERFSATSPPQTN